MTKLSSGSSLIRDFDTNITEKLKNSYSSKEPCTSEKGIEVYHEPFTHCVISDLVSDLQFVEDLKQECLSNLKYVPKNNDLYKFHQTKDLGQIKSNNIQRFRDEVLYDSSRKFIENLTNIKLSSKIDVTSSKYEHTDYLLCHDDDIHDDQLENGRRIAYIYYMVPNDWKESDGGHLDLFKVNENLQPTDILKSIKPKFNSLLFFEVSDRSFHQVAEVLSKSKCRLSINGWFHGKINKRPLAHIEAIPELLSLKEIDANIFFDWITEKYLKPQNQTEIQLKFMSSSEIKLDKVFHENKYLDITEALGSEKIVWNSKGPANRRNYEIADETSLPDIVAELIKVLTSDFMGLSLSNMTGLALHWSVKKAKDDEIGEDDYEDDDDDDDDDFSGDNEEVNYDSASDETVEESIESAAEEELNEETLKRKNNFNMMNNKKVKNESDDSKPGTSASKDIDHKKSEPGEIKSLPQASTSGDVTADEYGKPKFHCEVRRWKKGNYTLVTDDDKENKTKALDLMVFFRSKSWSLDCGGNISYIARDEDNELLTVNPEENCISLVYRDEETLKFTKCVNSKINELNSEGCFYEISVIYYE